MKIGAKYSGRGVCEFVVWAPYRRTVALKILGPQQETKRMQKDLNGYWRLVVEDIQPATEYVYQLDDRSQRADPASHSQPKGVHGPSQVVDHESFRWKDSDWKGMTLSDAIIYELHIGTFTQGGTFESVTAKLDDLCDLGVTALEMMPIAQFPGERNWGYDGSYPYAIQNTYGGPKGFKKLVDDCHSREIGVILDVVYNHLGPEGNYLGDFGPYFTDKYRTPWGKAINFDGALSDDVRNFFIENALFWFKNYHVDALRLDAVHAIFDMSAKPFLRELKETVDAFCSKQVVKHSLIAESDLNDPRLIAPRESGGYELDAQWLDDLHHALHALLTLERHGYYCDFGRIDDLVTALRCGYVYSGQYSKYRLRRHGASSEEYPAHKFIVFAQNHDQVGNRMLGERLSSLTTFEELKLAAGTVLLSPYIPLIFMGEEYGEDNAFLYFTDHSEPRLARAVREGRTQEFEAFRWKGEPPDPQSLDTFSRSKIVWEKRMQGRHRLLLEFYKHLINLRKAVPALRYPSRQELKISGSEAEKRILVTRTRHPRLHTIFNFNKNKMTVASMCSNYDCRKLLDSAESRWGGPGSSLPLMLTAGGQVELRGSSFAVLQERET